METNYEVYVQKKGDPRWNLEAQYGDGDKTRAVEDAKRLERTEYIDAVRVIRENYHEETNETKEFVVYTTKKEGKGKSRPSPADDPGGPDEYGGGPDDDYDDDEDEDAPGGKAKKKKRLSLFGRKSKDTEESEEDDDAPAAPVAAAVAGQPVPATGRRGTSVLLKFVIILSVSMIFAAIVTAGYVSIMIR